ncbi:MAG: arginine--tRNA ligase [Planktomarina sp.]|nr:arginine--tRNA ligase [Planktomarina sp.]
MNVFGEIRNLVIASLEKMQVSGDLPDGLSFDLVTVEPPKNPDHGDMATNAAMVLSSPSMKKPLDIAKKLLMYLKESPLISGVDIAGPGFLNINLEPDVWSMVLRTILKDPKAYGRSNIGDAKTVNVEYVSANPTGPLHIGHTRGAVFGDALASLLDFVGFDVTREYYINDGGAQVDVLARSVFLRYLEAHGQKVAFEDGTYPGDYLIEVGQALKAKFGDFFVGKEEQVWLADVRQFSIVAMMKLIKTDLSALGIKMDIYFSEKSLDGTSRIEEAITNLRDKGLIYEGTLEAPKGKSDIDWEPRKQTLFKSTKYGDDVDRPIQKSDGNWTYFAPDVAYHFDKVARGYNHLIDVFGADHSGYVKRMKAAVTALSSGQTSLDIKLIQLVRLFKNGEPFKMSKRAGTFVTLRELVEQVGADATRFVMLTRKNDASLDFDFDKVLEQTKENPIFYVQYAHARICSVMRRATDIGLSVDDNTLAGSDLNSLGDSSELSLAAKVAEFPRLVEIAARSNEPHRIAFYLYELASDFHSLWNKGNDQPKLRFLQEEDPATSRSKIALIRCTAVVISTGLGILGVTPAQEMR